jgi:hypothetical protein
LDNRAGSMARLRATVVSSSPVNLLSRLEGAVVRFRECGVGFHRNRRA